MKPADMQGVADVCRMLADPTRALLVETLARGTRTVGALCKELPPPLHTISHHLGLLRMAGLVERKQEGRETHYSLNRKALVPARAFLAKVR